MTKKKFFASLGVLTALVGTAVFGAMMCMGNASADAATLKDEVEPVSEAVSLASTASWENGELYQNAIWVRSSMICPGCGQSAPRPTGNSSGTFLNFVQQDGCDYTYLHFVVGADGSLQTVLCTGRVDMHNGREQLVKAATCKVPSIYTVVCSDCGASALSRTGEKLDHVYDDGVSVEANPFQCSDTVYTCTMCNEAKYYALTGTSTRRAHDAVLLSEIPSSCLVEGSKTYECSHCEHQWSLSTGYGEHMYPEEGIIVKEPTCLEPGLMELYCEVCNQKAEDDVVIPALNHKWVIVPEVEPTCTEPGREAGRQCENCEEWYGGSEPDEIPALGHDWSDWDESRESCTEVGSRTRTCDRCDEVETEELAAGQHSWNVGTVTKQPTCTENGIKSCECIYCGSIDEQTISAFGHTPSKVAAVAPTCLETGLTEGSKCSRCGVILEVQQLVPAKGHDLIRIPGVEPTVTSEGNIEYWHCNSCGSFFSDESGKTEISADDTILDRLPAEDGEGDVTDEDESGMSGWQIALAVVAGVVLLAGIGLILDKFVFNKDGNSVYDKAANRFKRKKEK